MIIHKIKQDDGTWRHHELVSKPTHHTLFAYCERVEMFKGKFHDEDINPEEIWKEVKSD